MPRVIHFEIHADDPDRAIKFYAGLFAWEFTKWDGPTDYWVIKTGPKRHAGINGGMIRRRGKIDGKAVIAYVCTVDVPSLEDSLQAVHTHGGTVVVPRMPIPGIGWLGYAKDTEGNIFGLMQSDSSAK
jgi:predicted enzyme related to lactoylglutathione lyase